MCGIVGYVGGRLAFPILINGLHRLEYRGYDSAGVALLDGELKVFKTQGKVADLEQMVGKKIPLGTTGLGHTRWATHGVPNQVNAHPHFSCNQDLVLVHNGIIENYAVLKQELQGRGHKFKSETDTEVLVHLIEDIQQQTGVKLAEAVRLGLSQVVGAYAIGVMSAREPATLVAARSSSPLVVGVGAGEFFLASDASPIVAHTKKVVYLEDGEIATLRPGKPLELKTLSNKARLPYIQKLELELDAIEKGGFAHFMQKEIFEQPKAIEDSFRGRLDPDLGTVRLGGIRDYLPRLARAKRITFVACGTSYYAGLVGKHLLEDLVKIPVTVDYASEFRYSQPLVGKGDFVIAISQSGETADTLAAIELAKGLGATVLGICNVVGSSIARATDAGVYTHAGPEIGVASTKAFTAQITVLTLLALALAAARKSLPSLRLKKLVKELSQIPRKVEIILDSDKAIKRIAKKFVSAQNALYLGRGYSFPVALEGALKLKEISYIHAEGLPAAEMKHGPIALIDQTVPTVVIVPKSGTTAKTLSNLAEIKARRGPVIAVITRGDKDVAKAADHFLEIPITAECLSPLLSIIPLQLLAYHLAVLRGCNVDQPRNLAKSVTVE